jgi:arylsulfatase
MLTYPEGSPFPGTIGRTLEDSVAAYPLAPTAAEGAQNIVLVVFDDVGFAQFGCFGSSIETPHIDRLASGGLRYRRFHTTAMCSPTRAAILTGRNPHSVGIGGITELASGFPGYHGRLNADCGFIPEVLRRSGWATYAVGKWHLCPAEEQHAAAPRTRWPLGVGFERFFGFLGPEANQFAPDLVVDNSPLPSVELPDSHLSERLVDTSISMIDDLRMADPNKPFLMYLAFGAAHAPHQAPQKWLDHYRGAFDMGWDEWREAVFARQLASGIIPPSTTLSPRPSWVPEWATLSEDDRRVAARLMEAFAAMLSHTDEQLGRLLDHLDRTGERDRTTVLLLSDNGASAEGGPTGTFNGAFLYNGMPHDAAATAARLDEIGGPNSFSNYPWGWAFAGNTPFRRWKRETHEGGIGDPLIVADPRIADGGSIRSQYVHAVDIGATMLELCGLDMPAELNGVAQRPVAGRSLVASFTDPAAPGRERQYYEQFGCRAIYREGWKAVAFHPLFPYEPGEDPFRSFDEDRWELYQVDVDPSECHDLAAEHPELLAELQQLWWSEASEHGALPLQGFRGAIGARLPKRQRAELRQNALGLPESTAPDTKLAPHVLFAEVTVGEETPNGVLICQGGRFGGFSLYLLEGTLHYAYNYFGVSHTDIASERVLGEGTHRLRADLRPVAGKMEVSLRIDSEVVATGNVGALVPLRFSLAGENLCCGYDDATAVSPNYEAPFRFNGTIHRAFVEVVDAHEVSDADLVRKALMSQ